MPKSAVRVKPFYRVTELARMAQVSPRRMMRMLTSQGVEVLWQGPRLRIVRASDVELFLREVRFADLMNDAAGLD